MTCAARTALSARARQGSIAHVTREGAPPSLLPLGAACVNQAVKGVAIARKCVALTARPCVAPPRGRGLTAACAQVFG